MALTLALAEQFIAACKQKAHDQGWQMSFVVVDVAGNPVASARMDGARWMTAGIAQSKAFTAATFKRSSKEVGELIGGVGASGGTEDEDVECAQAGLSAIGAE